MKAHVAVVGAGLVGTAIARRLAEGGLSVTCFGPESDAPPYSSHNDSGRIARVLDPSPVWAELASRSIAGYPEIQQRSGVVFHHPVGVLWSANAATLQSLDDPADRYGVDVVDGKGGWKDLVDLGADRTLLERGAAGYIRPKAMRKAHRKLAEAAGARFDPRTITDIDSVGDRWSLICPTGASLLSDVVVVAGGAGSAGLVDIDVTITGQVVMDVGLAPVIGRSIERLPCVGVLSDDPMIVGAYFIPPILTDEGWVLKFGAETRERPVLGTPADVSDWMTSQRHREWLPALSAAFGALLPGVTPLWTKTRPCIYTTTPTGLPYVGQIETGLYVATGGNGRMAKSADGVAELACSLIMAGEWEDALADVSFQPIRAGRFGKGC